MLLDELTQELMERITRLANTNSQNWVFPEGDEAKKAFDKAHYLRDDLSGFG